MGYWVVCLSLPRKLKKILSKKKENRLRWKMKFPFKGVKGLFSEAKSWLVSGLPVCLRLNMVSKIQDFLDSEVDDWKLSVTTHLWCDHYFRLLRRHFSLQLLVENPGEEPVWVPLPYDSTIAECLNLAQCSTRLTRYCIRVRLNPSGQLPGTGIPRWIVWWKACLIWSRSRRKIRSHRMSMIQSAVEKWTLPRSNWVFWWKSNMTWSVNRSYNRHLLRRNSCWERCRRLWRNCWLRGRRTLSVNGKRWCCKPSVPLVEIESTWHDRQMEDKAGESREKQ